MTWWIVSFSRSGSARYLSHLDTARAVERTFARAGVGLALSEGMRPKPRLSLPLPLPVGAAGREELAVVEVPPVAPTRATALAALRAAAPPGIVPWAIVPAGDRHPRPQPRSADYRCVVHGDAGRLQAAVERYRDATSVPYERVSPKGRRTLDLKEFIGDAVAEPLEDGASLTFSIAYRADGAARPQEFVDLIAMWAQADAVMTGLERRGIAWKDVPPDLGRGGGRSDPHE